MCHPRNGTVGAVVHGSSSCS